MGRSADLGKLRFQLVNKYADEGIPTSDRTVYMEVRSLRIIQVSSNMYHTSRRSKILVRNEINGLTLGGVGSGTVIENIEIVANQDDGVEWFGGTVNVKNVVVWNAGDDAIDTDQSWGGTLDNFIVINPGDECLELDGPEGIMVAKHFLKNGSIYAGNAQGLVDLDPNSNVDIDSVYFFGLKSGQDFDELPTDYPCTFTNFEATLPTGTVVTDFFKDGSDAFVTVVESGANTVGADASCSRTGHGQRYLIH